MPATTGEGHGVLHGSTGRHNHRSLPRTCTCYNWSLVHHHHNHRPWQMRTGCRSRCTLRPSRSRGMSNQYSLCPKRTQRCLRPCHQTIRRLDLDSAWTHGLLADRRHKSRRSRMLGTGRRRGWPCMVVGGGVAAVVAAISRAAQHLFSDHSRCSRYRSGTQCTVLLGHRHRSCRQMGKHRHSSSR